MYFSYSTCKLMKKMTNFISLSLQEFGLNDGITETITSFNPCCVCCLDKTAGFIRLSDCNHATYLQNVLKPKLEISNHFVCLYCHRMLIKIDAFRRQVLESSNILNSQNFQVNHVATVDIPHLRVPFQRNTTQHLDIDINDTNEIIQNFEDSIIHLYEQSDASDADMDADLPIANLKKRKKEEKKSEPKTKSKTNTSKVKTKTKTSIAKVNMKIKKNSKTNDKPPVRKRPEPMHKRFAGKIRMVTLTEQEMRDERERDSKNQSFLKLQYKCFKCYVGFDHEQNYTDHVQNRHTAHPGGVICSICESVLAAGCSYANHIKKHYTRYDCVECQKRYISLLSSIQHYNKTHGNVGVTYSCQHCDFKTEIISAYAYHRNKHRKDLKCEECGKVCSSNANLKRHLFEVHRKSNRVYECDVCKKVYNTHSGLKHHTNTAHSKALPTDAYCVECDIQFSSTHCYKAHLRLNSKHVTEDSKKYTCNECGTKFVTSGAMKRHIEWIHLKISKHQCTKCAELFRTSTLLKRHVSVVHERAPPPRNKICDYCGKGFTKGQVLRAHIRTHTGERPYRCLHCAATFAHDGALHSHYRRVHRANSRGVILAKEPQMQASL